MAHMDTSRVKIMSTYKEQDGVNKEQAASTATREDFFEVKDAEINIMLGAHRTEK